MTTIKAVLNSFESIEELGDLLENLTPKIGKLGGRRIVVDSGSNNANEVAGTQRITGDVTIKDIAKKFQELIKKPHTDKTAILKARISIQKFDVDANEKLSEIGGFKGFCIRFLTAIKRVFGGKFEIKKFYLDSFTSEEKAMILAADTSQLKEDLSKLSKDEINNLKTFLPKTHIILSQLANKRDINKKNKLKEILLIEFVIELYEKIGTYSTKHTERTNEKFETLAPIFKFLERVKFLEDIASNLLDGFVPELA